MPKIKVHNKIGFHCGPAGNHNGIGDYMKKLDAAGIPFTIKSVDHYGYCYEALTYNNAPHTVVFRLSSFGQPGDYNFDVPAYELDPRDAAVKHWEHMRNHMPPEFDPRRCWIEPINEIDKDRSDWLGHFASEFGEIGLRDGYKILQFGWSSGEPEPHHWETEGMLRYLKLCGENNEALGISLHEYSYDKEDIWRLKPDLVGRFTHLFDVADKYGYIRPKVVMSEWGWTHRRVPDREKALRHIESVNELYAKYPSILGAAIWYLGGGPEWDNVCNYTQRLIEPVTNFSLNYTIEVEQDMPAADTPPSAPTITLPGGMTPPAAQTVPVETQPLAFESATPAPPTITSNATFIADVTIPDDTPIEAGQTFIKTWRIRNSGQTAWDSTYKLAFISGDPMGDKMMAAVPNAQPGQIVELSLEMRAPAQKEGTVYSDWRLHNPDGHQFGDILYTRIEVTPPPPQEGTLNAVFAADVTIPDDTVMQAGQSFTKTWHIRNTGTKRWENCTLGFVGGARMAAVDAVPIPNTAPGQIAEVSIDMRAPTIPGAHWADFRPQDQLGNFFGDIIYVRIAVPQPEGQGRISPISQNDPRWKAARLGDAGSDTTIGAWGCLLTTFTMIANSFGKELTPVDLNRQLVMKRLFLDHKVTPWNALSAIYNNIIYEGRLEMRSTPNLTDRIDASLRQGYPVAVQVDYTPESPYTPNDQHWVLIVGREASDYRINEPWVYPSQEISMRSRYGRPNQSLRNSIISAVFYRSTKPQEPLPVTTGGVLGAMAHPAQQAKVLQTGMNINPDAPNSNPYEDDTFKGLDWVRFVYKISAAPDPTQRTLRAAFQKYDPIIKAYNKLGVKSLIILNQETVWGNAPWSGNNDWHSYADQLAKTAAQIARRYKRYGQRIAYEIWNEGDLQNNPASVYVPPEHFAVVLKKVSEAIRKETPEVEICFGGMASGPNHIIPYVQQVQAAAGGQLPVDALGIHPYGRWGTKAPFDWGNTFGTLVQAFDQYKKAFPDLPLWITEIGVAADHPIGPEHYAEIGAYIRDVYHTVGTRHLDQVPVLIWFAWSDLMRNSGIVQVNGNQKEHVYAAFKEVRDKEIV